MKKLFKSFALSVGPLFVMGFVLPFTAEAHTQNIENLVNKVNQDAPIKNVVNNASIDGACLEADTVVVKIGVDSLYKDIDEVAKTAFKNLFDAGDQQSFFLDLKKQLAKGHSYMRLDLISRQSGKTKGVMVFYPPLDHATQISSHGSGSSNGSYGSAGSTSSGGTGIGNQGKGKGSQGSGIKGSGSNGSRSSGGRNGEVYATDSDGEITLESLGYGGNNGNNRSGGFPTNSNGEITVESLGGSDPFGLSGNGGNGQIVIGTNGEIILEEEKESHWNELTGDDRNGEYALDEDGQVTTESLGVGGWNELTGDDSKGEYALDQSGQATTESLGVGGWNELTGDDRNGEYATDESGQITLESMGMKAYADYVGRQIRAAIQSVIKGYIDYLRY